MKILILATIVLSAITAIFPAISTLLKKKTVSDSFDSFVCSFLGGLLGGVIGVIIGYALGYIVYLIVPLNSGLMFGNFEKIVGFALVLFICWFVCTLTGAIKTIKPSIEFFSNRNN